MWMIFGLSLKSIVCWAPASWRSQLMGMWSRRFMSRWEKWTFEPAEREKTVSVRKKDMMQRERETTLPGPAMMAPPCWCRSPWKSNAGLVMALHIVLIWPIKIPDFTWGLGCAEFTKTDTKTKSHYHLKISLLIHSNSVFAYQSLWMSPLSSSPAFGICACLGPHIFHKDSPWASRTTTWQNKEKEYICLENYSACCDIYIHSSADTVIGTPCKYWVRP